MIDDVRNLLEKYLVWLKDKTTLRQIKDWVEITTPYLDRHNDHLQMYVRQRDGGYLLTDGGYVIQDLAQSGCNLDSPKRQALLNTILNGFGVKANDGQLEVRATPENFGAKKHSLVQTMLAVNDMFCMATPMIASLFYEDVVSWLDLHEIRYTPKVKFTGTSGYDHLFDFVIPKSSRQPERVLHTINRPNRDTAQALAFAWIDTREVRPPESRAYAFLNDAERTVQPAVLDALRSYDLSPLPWSTREDVREELAA